MTLGLQHFTLVAWLLASGCHSANWSPPEPQQAPDPAATPPVVTVEPAPPSKPELSASEVIPPPPAPAPPTAPSSEAPAASSSAAATVTEAPATPASASPASSGDAKPKSSVQGSPKASVTAAAPPDAYTGPDPCQGKTFHYSVVRSACKKAGQKAVKDIMRGVVKKAKAAGEDIQCTSCHTDTSSYLLKPNAVSDLKKWL